MSNAWSTDRPVDAAWRPPSGMGRAQRGLEQDEAAGSRPARVVPVSSDSHALASIALRMPQPGRRVYAYLRWNVDGHTNERYVGEVSGENRADFLRDGWQQVIKLGLLPRTPREALVANSWATTPAARNVMRANRRRDTKPERELRSQLHGRGLRYRVDYQPIPGLRRRADIVFSRARLAVFVDGCFWHGCPDHYRPATKHADFWHDKRAENALRDRRTDNSLHEAGWRSIRVWEHENMAAAAERIATLLRTSAARANL